MQKRIQKTYAPSMLRYAKLAQGIMDEKPILSANYKKKPTIRQSIENLEDDIFVNFADKMKNMGSKAVSLICESLRMAGDPSIIRHDVYSCCANVAAIGSVVLREGRPDIDHKLVFGYAEANNKLYDHCWLEVSDDGGKIHIYDSSNMGANGNRIYRHRMPIVESDGLVDGQIIWQRSKFASGDMLK
jgi:hypothetical protein